MLFPPCRWDSLPQHILQRALPHVSMTVPGSCTASSFIPRLRTPIMGSICCETFFSGYVIARVTGAWRTSGSRQWNHCVPKSGQARCCWLFPEGLIPPLLQLFSPKPSESLSPASLWTTVSCEKMKRMRLRLHFPGVTFGLSVSMPNIDFCFVLIASIPPNGNGKLSEKNLSASLRKKQRSLARQIFLPKAPFTRTLLSPVQVALPLSKAITT